ncbi:MAG: CopG family antitoxin [Desulfitobacteriaceae bacterium]
MKSRAQNRLKMVSLRLREDQIKTVKIIAARKDIPYQTLLRSWINQAIQSEYHTTP